MFKKARDRVMQTVGLAERIPTNPLLISSAEGLKQIAGMIVAMRKSVETYAGAMLAVGDASRILASDISFFYRSSPARTKTVGLFTSAMVDQESNVLFLFKEQFGWDVSREFDQWTAQCNTLRDRIFAIDNEYTQLQTSYVDSRTMHGKEEQLNTKAKAVSAEVTRFLESRFARFDKIFIRLMEFQKEFFHEGVEVTDKFDPIVKQYRDRVSLSGAGVNEVKTSASPDTKVGKPAQPVGTTDNQAKPSPTTSASTVSPSPSSTTSPVHPSPTSLKASPSQSGSYMTSTPAPTPAPASVSASAPTSKPSAQHFEVPSSASSSSSSVKREEVDLFGGLFSNSSTANAKPTTSSTSKPSSASASASSFDILGMNSPSPSQNTSAPKKATNDSFDFASFATPSQTSNPTSSSNMSFDADFFSVSSQPQRTTSNTKSAPLSFDSFPLPTTSSTTSNLDDIDDHVSTSKPKSSGADDELLSGFTYSSKPSGSSSNSNSSSSLDMFDPLSTSFVPSNSNSSSSASAFQHQNLPQGPELTESEEQDAIHAALSTIEPVIHNWRYKNGMEKEIPALLSSLTTVLWDGHNWKKVDITNLLDYTSVKKSYRRALLTVHPDKVSGSTPLIKATAERIFEVLNNSFKQYEIKLGMRSAN